MTSRPAAKLLPQAPPMRLLYELAAFDGEEALCHARLAEAGFFLDAEDRDISEYRLELMAQAAAAWIAADAPGDAPPRRGYLTALRDMSLDPTPHLSESLLVRVRREQELDGRALFRVRVESPGGGSLAEGMLQVFAPQEGQEPKAIGGPEAPEQGRPPAAADAPLERAVRAWLEREPEIMTLAPDFPALAGHFPGRPVLPGVALLCMARLLAARACGHALRTRRIERVKFLRPLGPGARLRWELEPAEDAEGPTLRARCLEADGGEELARMQMAFSKVG